MEKRMSATRHVPRDAGKFSGRTRYTELSAGDGGGGLGNGGGRRLLLWPPPKVSVGGGGAGDGGGSDRPGQFGENSTVALRTPNQRHDVLRAFGPLPFSHASKMETMVEVAAERHRSLYWFL